ncbi:MAG: ABC transporter ATP-binding protein [Deltaproteobacteria bacterium]|nr:ABC transporter ATP-binding protein [Deltaproteobacteria bacterium]
MKPVIEVKNLKTHFDTPFGTARAVDGVSFDIAKGETFAIVGESGCGKSMTALSIIQLVPEPSGKIAEGEILLNGKEITRLTEAEKRDIRGASISMIFQEPMTSLNPVFTIGEQIAEAIRLHQGKNKDEARKIAIEMLGKVRMRNPDTLYNEYPHRLSGGMRQRVMIAMALSCRPDLLIADEPTTALDVTIQEEILKLIAELKKELGMAVLLITHNMALVKQNAARVAVMYAGKIVELAPVENVFKRPLHPYTVKLLNSMPAAVKRGKALDTIPGTVPASTDYGAGCRFAGRCDKEMAGCRAAEPLLLEVEAGHTAACHLFDKEFMASDKARPVGVTEKTEPPKPAAAATSKETILDIQGLKQHFPIKKGFLKRTKGHVKAVDGIDISVRKGSTLALVGESGCGKTTAGKSILRLIEPTGGKILFGNTDISALAKNELRNFRSKIQIIFQDPYSSLNPRMTAGDIIAEGIRSLKPGLSNDETERKIDSVLSLVGLTADAKGRYPHEFSGGQRQRIGIARVLAVDPEFIICDEATSALDVSVQAQILNLLKSIQRELGISFLFITHDLGVVEYIADEVAIMQDGRIVEHGTVEEIFSSPQNEYTKKLLAAVPRL